MKAKPDYFKLFATTIVVFAWGATADVDSADAQIRRIEALGRPMPMRVMPTTTDDTTGSMGGKASLKTDPDLEGILKNAQRFLNDKNYGVAGKMWQIVLQRSGDSLYSSDDEIYYSLGRRVEQLIRELPPEGLRTYRVTADANAKEIMAEGRIKNRHNALSKIVKEYFISSLGDDAAYELGCGCLDRFDFVGAIRHFQRIVDDYPDPSVELDQVWLRIALSYAYAGNQEQSQIALEKARETSDNTDSIVFTSVVEEIKKASTFIARSGSNENWMLNHGNGRRHGVMAKLPVDYLDSDLQPIFQFKVAPTNTTKSIRDDDYLGSAHVGEDATGLKHESMNTVENKMIDSWQKHQWRPTGNLLIHEDRVIFKSIADLTVWSKKGDSDSVIWRPAWLNQFVVDDSTMTRKTYRRQYNQNIKASQPTNDSEIFFFGDAIAQSMSIHRGVVYNVEGPNYDATDQEYGKRTTPQNQYGAIPRRTRTNYLTAYDLETGHFLWRLPPPQFLSQSTEEKPTPTDESEEEVDIGFMSAPIGFGGFLLVPVNSAGSIYIYALDSQNDGQVVWKCYLTDEPSGGADPWAPVTLSIEGSDLYATCGSGAFFVIDPSTGTVRFARRYARSGKLDKTMPRQGTQLVTMVGWKEDIVVPYANVAIVFASDMDMIYAYDRQTGEFVWKCPFEAETDSKVEYLIGIYDDMLYAGGSNEVIAYDLKGEGRMVWTASWTAKDHLSDEASLGRGMVTPDAVYIPVDDSILKLDLKTGKPIARAGVRLDSGSPVGNLYSDGEKIWTVCGNRLYALGKVPEVEESDDAEEDKDAEEGESDNAEKKSDADKADDTKKKSGDDDNKSDDDKKSGKTGKDSRPATSNIQQQQRAAVMQAIQRAQRQRGKY